MWQQTLHKVENSAGNLILNEWCSNSCGWLTYKPEATETGTRKLETIKFEFNLIQSGGHDLGNQGLVAFLSPRGPLKELQNKKC